MDYEEAKLKNIIEKYLDVSITIDEITRKELMLKPGLIILNKRVVALSLVNCKLNFQKKYEN